VVCLGWISLQFDKSGISAFRVVRILRPLRTINSIPGMAGLVQTIFQSMPSMGNILLLFGFFLIIFGTIGV
jgi:sensor histidine kinase YesM